MRDRPTKPLPRQHGACLEKTRGDLGNFRPVALPSIPRQMLEQMLRKAICKPVEVGRPVTSSQRGFTINKLCPTSLTSCYNRVAAGMDAGPAMGFECLNFSKALDKSPHDHLRNKVEKRGLLKAAL